MSTIAARRKPAEPARAGGLAPFSLKDAPAFIERQFPVGRLSAEAYKERKAVAGQTLTALGSYWKGRKPLVLVRAVVLGCLLPATDDPVKDLDIFLKLMAMDDGAFVTRLRLRDSEVAQMAMASGSITERDLRKHFRIRDSFLKSLGRAEPREEDWAAALEARALMLDTDEESERRLRLAALSTLTYDEKVQRGKRAEECDEAELLAPIWPEVNAHLGTDARSLAELVEQLGIARFGRRPKVADTFCGGGSIPFEAARLGCDVYASDLNPIACMLTWGAFNLIGMDAARKAEIERAESRISSAINAEIARLGIEHDEHGNRAKAYLYCLETRCPKTQWMVPMLPSLVISETRSVIAKLVPDKVRKRYNIVIETGVSEEELTRALNGTVRDGRLVHPMNPERSGVEIKTIRGDYRDSDGATRNNLRLWEKADFFPRESDVFQERLYCIQWITKDTIGKHRQTTFFATVTNADISREARVNEIVQQSLARWQSAGIVSDMEIETGKENEGPIRTNGWKFWHQMFMPRAILNAALLAKHCQKRPELMLSIAKYLDNNSKSCRWKVSQSGGDGGAVATFDSQALRTIFNWAFRTLDSTPWRIALNDRKGPVGAFTIACAPANSFSSYADLFVSDPPYADSIRYEEITEFFIAWLRKNPPPPFDAWTWDSQRAKAIKGKDEEFRRAMVEAYAAMTRHMPDNGLQVVMFTHQDAEVWANLGAILWAAGLRVVSAWNVATETTSALKDGNYVQGTICLVLRKRLGAANARRMEIEAEIEDAVKAQIGRLTALGEQWPGEMLYKDGDLTLAAYAAALQVVTAYSTIDRQPLDRDLYRKLGKGEKSALRELIDYAAQVANGILLPEGFPREMWRDLDPASRFYVRMLDMEDKGTSKLSDFQDFAKSFAFGGYTDLMASTSANAAKLAGAEHLKGRMLDGGGFAATPLRKVLFAIWKTIEKGDPKLGVTTLRTDYPGDYWQRRQHLIGLAEYIAAKTKRTRPTESQAAHELAEALKVDRV